MRLICATLALALFASSAAVRASSPAADDWQTFGRMLSLVHSFVRIAAQSPDPQAMNKGVDAMLAGENEDVNRAAQGLFQEMFEDMPPQYRGQVAAVAQDLVGLARRERARAALQPEPLAVERALQARKDLHAMGLRYHDAQQFLEAVRRNDALAVELYLHARGVNLSARDAEGRSALEIARASGDQRMLALFERERASIK